MYILTTPLLSPFVPVMVVDTISNFISYVSNDFIQMIKSIFELLSNTSHLKDENENLINEINALKCDLSKLDIKCSELQSENNELSLKCDSMSKINSTSYLSSFIDKAVMISKLGMAAYQAYDILINGNINIHPSIQNERFSIIMASLRNIISHISKSNLDSDDSESVEESIDEILKGAFDNGPNEGCFKWNSMFNSCMKL